MALVLLLSSLATTYHWHGQQQPCLNWLDDWLDSDHVRIYRELGISRVIELGSIARG
jgi:hypothetical protein